MSLTKTKDFSVSQEEFELVYDQEYDLYKTNPIPENLGKYYDSEDYISHTDAKKSIVDKLYQVVKKYTLKTKANLLNHLIDKQEASVLDIGCGTGSFLEVLKIKNWNTVGVEPNKKARILAEEKGIFCVEETSQIKNQTFDCITMWHVLEHVIDIEKQFLELKRLLKPNGVLIIAVPNFKSYDAKYYKKYWAAFDVPRHVWHFSTTAIQKIGKDYNFKLTKIKPMWFDSFYVSLLSEKYKSKKVNYFRVFIIGLFSNLKAVKNNEFSSKIYVLK